MRDFLKKQVSMSSVLIVVGILILAPIGMCRPTQTFDELIVKGDTFLATDEGNVGIGTTEPIYPLQVRGGTENTTVAAIEGPNGEAGTYAGLAIGPFNRYGGQIRGIDDGANGQLAFATQVSGRFVEQVRITANGNVGIGTTEPITIGDGSNPTILHVHKEGNSTLGGIVQLTTHQTAIGTTAGAITFGSTGLSNDDKRLGEIAVLKTNSSTTGGTGDMVFTSWNDGIYTESIRIKSDGNVGIGTDAPTERLDVDGNIHVSGEIISGNSIRINGTNDTITVSSGSVSFEDANLVTRGIVRATAFEPGDIVFRKDGEKLWRMFEDEEGLYLENLKTADTSKVLLKKDQRELTQLVQEQQKTISGLVEKVKALEEQIQKLKK